MNKVKETFKKNKRRSFIVIIAICLVIAIVVLYIAVGNGRSDRKRAKQLEKAVETEMLNIKKKIPKIDRDTFVTVGNKVVVGFVSLPNQEVKYPVINVFNDNTNTYSLCRNGEGMPWDINGMTIYGIDSFTKVFEKLEQGEKLEFKDLAGKKYEYSYEKKAKEKAVDYSITICNVSKKGDINKKYLFVEK